MKQQVSFSLTRLPRTFVRPMSSCSSKRRKREPALPRLVLPQISFLGSISRDLGFTGHGLELGIDSFEKYLSHAHHVPDADSKNIPPTTPRSCSQIPSRFLTSSHSPQHPSGGRLSGLALPVLLEVLRQQVRCPPSTLWEIPERFAPSFTFQERKTEVSREGVTTQLGKDGWGSPSPDLQAPLLTPPHPPPTRAHPALPPGGSQVVPASAQAAPLASLILGEGSG